MSDFNLRSDSIQVEQIMEQIRARIREKRGVDYTEQQIRELAAVKLEKLLDPRGVRSDLLEHFRRIKAEHEPAELPNYAFEEETLYESHRAPIRFVRRLLRPILKLFFNPNRLVQALNIQSRLNTLLVQREAARRGVDELYFEVIHNLVLETTRLGIEVKNLKMRVESLASRLDFDERRARALESAVVYRPSGEGSEHPPAAVPRSGAPAAPQQVASSETNLRSPTVSSAPPAVGGGVSPEGPGQRSRRRRRRRGRRGGGPPMAGAASGAPPWGQPREDEAHHAASQGAAEISTIPEAKSAGDAQAAEPRGEASRPDDARSEDVEPGAGEPDPQ